jgi:hypothetical protein
VASRGRLPQVTPRSNATLTFCVFPNNECNCCRLHVQFPDYLGLFASIQGMFNHVSYFINRVVSLSGKVTFMIIWVGFVKIISVKKRSAIANT